MVPDDVEPVLLRLLMGLGPLGSDSRRTFGVGKLSRPGEKVSFRGLVGTKDDRRGDGDL